MSVEPEKCRNGGKKSKNIWTAEACLMTMCSLKGSDL